ncbi:hypothetical protein PMAYCL1PPCAC_27402, partial [Pristionchus mayeri]
EWKRKICEFSLRSDDPLISVISKGFDSIIRILKNSEHCHIRRALGSLDRKEVTAWSLRMRRNVRSVH